MNTVTCFLCAIVVAATSVYGQEWTRFRGPNGAGVSDAKTIPAQWTEKDINWRIELPGQGHSSPVLWGDKLFLTSCDEKTGTFYVLCFNAVDGSKRWQKDFPLTPYRKHNYNTLASGTPTVDAERVYVNRVEAEHDTVLALDHDGKKIWEYDVGHFRSQHGSGASPIVFEGKVIFPNEQDGESCLVAIDAKSGELRWKTPRKTKPSSAAYSTPCVYQPKGGKPELIFNSEVHGVSALAPDTGKIVWEFPAAFDKRSVSSPVLAGNLVIGSCGSGGGGNFVVAVRPGEGEKKPERAYEVRKSAPYVPTSVCVGEWLYLWSDGGIVSRVKAATGEVQWQERAGEKVNFFSSPLCVDGKLFNVSTSGEVIVVGATDKFEVLGRYPLNETTHSTPAVAGGRMYIHTTGHLISVGGAKPTP